MQCANEMSGLQRRVKIKAIPTRQGSVLTNQCLGMERMLSEGLGNPSFPKDSHKLIVEGHSGHKTETSLAVTDPGRE
jgi:hypothetical protein